jgi:hypothetical protein
MWQLYGLCTASIKQSYPITFKRLTAFTYYGTSKSGRFR